MALLSTSIKAKEFDVRMVQRGLAKGLFLHEDIERHLKKLPDDAANADYINLDAIFESAAGNSGLRD